MSVSIDTVLAAQQTLAQVKAKHDQYAKELTAAQRRLERKATELAQAEKSFAEIKAAFGTPLPTVPAKK